MVQYGMPEVFESDAHGIVKEVYEDIKYVLKVPIVNFIFRALANYPEFLAFAWQQVRPNMLTANMETAAEKLRFPNIETNISTYDFSKDYNPMDLSNIYEINATFQYVNPKLLLIASAWMESLGSRHITPKQPVTGFIQPGIYPSMPSIELVHVTRAPDYLQQLLLDIAKKHYSFDIASDYRALADYPRFLEVSWYHLKKYLGTKEYSILKSDLLNRAVTSVRKEMPYPVEVNRYYLESIYSPTQIAGIMGIVAYFHRFLPGLIVENEFIRRMLESS